MNLLHFFLTSIYAVTALADPNDIFPLVLFAKVNSELVPLKGAPFTLNGNSNHVLVHKDPSAIPLVFTLKGERLYTWQTSNPGFVGFSNNYLAFGSSVDASSWNWDGDSKIIGVPFYLCESFNDKKQYIQVGEGFKSNKECIKVDVYLLSSEGTPNKFLEAKKQIDDKNKTDDFVKHDAQVFKGNNSGIGTRNLTTPHVFVAKLYNTTVMLSNFSYSFNNAELNILSYEISPTIPAMPVNFTLMNNFAITHAKQNPGNITLSHGVISFGRGIPPAMLKFDNNTKLLNERFQSCEIVGTGRRGIFYHLEILNTRDCVDAEIYLWPYKKAIASVSKNISKVKENVHMGEKNNNTELVQSPLPKEQPSLQSPTNITSSQDDRALSTKEDNTQLNDLHKKTDKIEPEDIETVVIPEDKTSDDIDHTTEPELEISDSEPELGHDEATIITDESLNEASGDKGSDMDNQHNTKLEESDSDHDDTKPKSNVNLNTSEQEEREASYSDNQTAHDEIGKDESESKSDVKPAEVKPENVKPETVKPGNLKPGIFKPVSKGNDLSAKDNLTDFLFFSQKNKFNVMSKNASRPDAGTEERKNIFTVVNASSPGGPKLRIPTSSILSVSKDSTSVGSLSRGKNEGEAPTTTKSSSTSNERSMTSDVSPSLSREYNTSKRASSTSNGMFSTDIICTECKDASDITIWRTYTYYTTYCPEATTVVTMTVCKEEECHPSTVTVTTATTLTISGKCVAPETTTESGAGHRKLKEGLVTAKLPQGSIKTGHYTSKLPEEVANVKKASLKKPTTTKILGSLITNIPTFTNKAWSSQPNKSSNTIAEIPSFVNSASQNTIGVFIFGLLVLVF